MSKLYFLFGGAALAGGGIATTISLTAGKTQTDQENKGEKPVLGEGVQGPDGLIISGNRNDTAPSPKLKREK